MKPPSQGERLESALPNAKTQRGEILALLVKARGEWVGLPEVMKCAAQYNARIYELRRTGFNIENRSETDPETGARHSWFRLRNVSEQAAAAQHQPSRFEQAHQKDLERDAPLFAGERP